jgi:flagellin
MSSVIRTNVSALTANRNLSSVSKAQSTASERLSSGKKVNSAADDAAGLAISSKMQAQIKGLDMASKNAEDAISLIQTADGSMSEIDDMVQRIRELTVQAANDTNTTTGDATGAGDDASEIATTESDKYKIGLEIGQLLDEIDQMSARTEFNTKTLTTGNYGDDGAPLQFQIGANANQQIGLTINSVTSGSDGLNLRDIYGSSENFTGTTSSATDVATAFEEMTSTELTSSLTTIDTAVAKVAIERANLGAVQNRLEYTNENLQVSSENLSSAKSNIEDADMGEEMMNYTTANVLQQAATSMLAQANQAPQTVLQLIQ